MGKLYLGSREQLEKRLAAEVSEAKKNNPFYPVVVVISNNLAGVSLRRVLASRFGSHCRVRFMTLKDVISELFREAEKFKDYEPLPFYGEEWLAGIVAGQEGPGSYFGPLVESRGFRQVLLQFFRELDENNLEQVPMAEEAEPDRISSLQRLYDSYRRRKDPFYDKVTGINQVSESLPPKKSFKLLIFGLHNLSPLEKILVKALLQCGELEPAVLWPDWIQRFSPQKELLRWFQECGLAVCSADAKERKTASHDNLDRLRTRIFDRENRQALPAPVDGSLTFISAPDELQEVSEITREIIKLAREGLNFNDLAVLVPDSAYSYQCAASFAAAGVPFYRSGGTPLDQTRTGRSLLLFLDLVESDFPRRLVSELLAYAPLSLFSRSRNGRPANPALWDQLALQAGIVRGRRQWFELIRNYRIHLEKQREEDQPGEEELYREQIAALETLSDTIEMLGEAANKISVCRSWKEFAAAAEAFMVTHFEPAIETDSITALLKQLAFLDRLGGDYSFKAARFAIHDLLQSGAIPQGRFQRSGVNIVPLAGSSGLQFEVVFIPGLNESVFPASFPADPLIPEVERRKLQGSLPPHSGRFLIDALNYTQALYNARKRAVVSWSRFSTLSGRELFPSSFIYQGSVALLGKRAGLEELNLLPGFKEIQAVAVSSDPLKAVSAEEFDLAASAVLPTPEKVEVYLSGIGAELGQLITADATRRHHRLTPHQGLFRPGGRAANLVASEIGPADSPLAITGLEEYARCPFDFYLKHLLEVTFIEEPEELFALPPDQKGRLIHRILELFYRQASEKAILPAAQFPEQCRKLLTETSRSFLDQYEKHSMPLHYPLVWTIQQRELNEIITAFLEWEINCGPDNMIPRYFEKRIGYPGDPKQFSINLNDGRELFLKGRIDRIDCGAKVLRVIDYKTGRRKGKDISIGESVSLQPPLYMIAACRLFERSVSAGDSAHYYYLSPRGVETVNFDGENWPEKENQIRQVISFIYEGITGGRFFPYPGRGSENCRYCGYKTICGPDVARMIGLGMSSDPSLQQFRVMKGDQ